MGPLNFELGSNYSCCMHLRYHLRGLCVNQNEPKFPHHRVDRAEGANPPPKCRHFVETAGFPWLLKVLLRCFLPLCRPPNVRRRHRPKKAQRQMCHRARFLNSLHTSRTFTAAQRLAVVFHVHLFTRKRGGSREDICASKTPSLECRTERSEACAADRTPELHPERRGPMVRRHVK